MIETLRQRRGHAFFTEGVPPLYATEGTPAAEKVIVTHYFVGACDWWIAEADPDTGIAFGYCDLGNGGGEWGYVSLVELEALVVHGWLVVERDIHWTPTVFGRIRRP